jgi:Na+-transporting NADH:ubiquinone oxidoreductase subunit NqrF
MKKLTLTTVLLSSFLNVHSQDAVDIASKEVCSCANEKMQYVDNVQNEQKDAFLYICTTDIFNNNLNAILKEYGVSSQLEGTYDRFSKDVNDYLTNNCPDVLPKKATIAADSSGQIENNNSVKEEGVIECNVLNIANYQYPTIEARDKKGVLQSFIIYKPFSTDILFTAGGIKVGNNIKVSYETLDIYDNNAKDFKTFKVVTQLEKLR